MPFDWNDFLTLASQLAPKHDEASKRTAIGRAYYCIYNIASARAELRCGPRPRNTSSHQWCWEQYKRTPNSACARLGTTGDRLKRMRQRADYKNAPIARLDEQVQSVLDDAREFLEGFALLDAKFPCP